MEQPGRVHPSTYLRRLSRTPYFFTLVAAAWLTWTDVGRQNFPHGVCYAETAIPEEVQGPSIASSPKSDTHAEGSPPEGKGVIAAWLSYSPSAFTYGLPDLLDYVPFLFLSAAGNGGAGPVSQRDDLSASGQTSGEQPRLSTTSLLQAVYDFVRPSQDGLGDTTADGKDLSRNEGHSDSITGIITDPPATPASCSESSTCNLYGRVVQAVSSIIPRRLFNEDGEDDDEEIGFLSRRRPSKGRSKVPETAHAAQTDAVAEYAVGQAEKATFENQGEAQPQRAAAVADPADGGSNWGFGFIDYSLGGTRQYGKRRPRLVPVRSPLLSSSHGGPLSDTNSTGDEQASTVRDSERKKQQQQHQHQEALSEAKLRSGEEPAPETHTDKARHTPVKNDFEDGRLRLPHEEEEGGSSSTAGGSQSSDNRNSSTVTNNNQARDNSSNSDSGNNSKTIATSSGAASPGKFKSAHESENAKAVKAQEETLEPDSAANGRSRASPMLLGKNSAKDGPKEKDDTSSHDIVDHSSAHAPSSPVTNTNKKTANDMTNNDRSSAAGTGSERIIRPGSSESTSNATSNMPAQQTSTGAAPGSIKENKGRQDKRDAIRSNSLALKDTNTSNTWANPLHLPIPPLFPMPLDLGHLFVRNTDGTAGKNLYPRPASRRTLPANRARNTSSRRRTKRKPAVTLDTLREGGGLGSSFAQAVDASSAFVDVLTASRDLKEAIEGLDLSAFGLPAPKSAGEGRSRSASLKRLDTAAKALEEFVNWAETVDHAIHAGKQLTDSVLSNIQTSAGSLPFLSTTEDLANAESVEDSEFYAEQRTRAEDWKSAAVAALTAAAQKAERLQAQVQESLRNQGNSGITTTGLQAPQAASGNSLSIVAAAIEAAERALSLLQNQQPRDTWEVSPSHAKDEQQRREQAGSGLGSLLLPHVAGVAEQVGSLLRADGSQEGDSPGEYVMPLLRELYRVARSIFEVLDISISIADESMTAMQLGQLLRLYEELVEEGKLAAVGLRLPRVPKRMGPPKVSCANKGMTCCVPAEAAGPEWKQKHARLFLQNLRRQECRAVFVSRSNMLCASTPYENSTCNITHTKTAALDKYSVLLPVSAFTGAALCECEVSRERNSEGLHTLEGNAEWTTGKIQADLLEEARKGWQYVKRLSNTGNSLTRILDATFGTPQTTKQYNLPQGQKKPGQQKPQHRQQARQKEQLQRQELAEKPFNGLAEAITKVLMNQQLLKLLNSEKPATIAIPPISVSMHLPEQTKSLLPALELPQLLALPGTTAEEKSPGKAGRTSG